VGGVESAPVTNDQGLPVAPYMATYAWRHVIALWEVLMLIEALRGFLWNPHFGRAKAQRCPTGRPKVNLSDPLEWMADGSGFSPATVELAKRLGYR
jgi:hypothetical protein